VLGLLILLVFPEAAEWVLGLLFGIDLIVNGLWLTMMSLILRRLDPGRPPESQPSPLTS